MSDAAAVAALIKDAKRIVVMQAENPDGDSLATALALEHILGDQNKDVMLYCPVQMPRHLRYLPGWDRVSKDLPNSFDLSILVDTASASLIGQILTPEQQPRLKSRPMLVIDHHTTEGDIKLDITSFVVPEAVATGEVVYDLAKELDWPLSLDAQKLIASSIMSDSLGLTTDATTAQSIRIIADLVENGVSLAELEAQRRTLMGKSFALTKYKGELLQRIEIAAEGQLAFIDIPWEEIQEYSDKYNPSVLVIDDMRLIEGVKLAIAFKTYPDTKLTAKIRANQGYAIAHLIAENFGGGGHPYAAGFKLYEQSLEQVKREVVDIALKLLKEQEEKA